MKYRFRRRLIYTLLLFIDKLFLLIPYNISIRFARFCSKLVYIVLGKYRRLTKKHLKLAFGNTKTEKEISKIARKVFIYLGLNLIEILSLPKIKNRLSSMIDIRDIKKIDDALAKGKGAVAVTGHFGNWELIPIIFALKGYAANVIARPIYYDKYNEWVTSLRSDMGVNVIYRTDSPKKVLRLLHKNELVGIAPDQDIDSVDGVFVDFFGRKTYTPTGPVKIAMAAGSPIVPIFIVRDGRKHTIHIEDPIVVENTDNKPAAIKEYTQKWSNAVESYVRKYPEQWVWMHERWKTKVPA